MSIGTSNPVYRETHLDLSRITLKGTHTFASKERELELIISQSMPDEEADPFENIVLPLTVLLVEETEKDNSPEKDIYEDGYSFTLDGDFIGHWYRESIRDKTGHRNSKSKILHDGDISKLYRYGEAIKTMMENRALGSILKNHPTVERLRTHTLWKYPC